MYGNTSERAERDIPTPSNRWGVFCGVWDAARNFFNSSNALAAVYRIQKLRESNEFKTIYRSGAGIR